MLPQFLNLEIEDETNNKQTKKKHPLFVLDWRLFGPWGSHVGGEGHVVVGAGGRLVGQVRRKEGRPVVLDDHRVVLRHVDRRGELVVS